MARNQYPLSESGLNGEAASAFAAAVVGWRNAAGPFYRRLAGAVRAAIESGAVLSGSRVPAERGLAKQLGVSRTTVVAAYDVLREEGWLESRQGSGTRARHPGGSRGRLALSAFPHRVYRVLAEAQGDTVEFLGAHLAGLGALAERFFASGEAIQNWAREPGYFPLGLPELRRAVARHLARGGLPTTEEQVLVTSGAQQAIGLAASFYLRRGDAVALEDPTYLGAIDVFHALGARMIPIPVGKDGVRLDALRETLRKQRPRLVYLMPTFQNPTGAVLPERERRRLARMCDELEVPLVEDNTLADLALGAEPPPPVAAFSGTSPILTIGSLSKLFWGGLRIGWIRAAEPIIARLAPLKTMADLGSSVPSQAVALKLFRDAERIRAMRRREIAERLERLLRELERQLPSWTYTRPAGGLSLWVRLPHGSAAEFARVALRHGVSVLPGNLASPEGRFADHLRLPFVLECEVIREGVDRLARAWSAYAPAERLGRQKLGVLV